MIILKKIIFCFFSLSLFFTLTLTVYAQEETTTDSNSDSSISLASSAKSAIMIEASTGTILFEKNSHEELPMASMTKMMTMLLIMEALDNGSLTLEEEVTASDYASSMGGSQIFLEPGEKMTVNDLLKGIAIGSGNDAAVAMAERLGGTEEGFVKMMNNKAQELGLKNTHFVNACGLDTDNHYSSSYDMAMIAQELVKHEKILEYTGTYEDYLRTGTDNSFWLVNTNRLVRFYQGVDGLKTGYTTTAGYCITTTAKRNGMRLITVVMNEPTSATRNSETTAMLDYGFNLYTLTKLIKTDTVVATKKVFLGETEIVNIVPKTDVNILSLKTSTTPTPQYKYQINSLKAPLKVGDVVGQVDIINDGKVTSTVDLTVEEDVPKVNFFINYLRNLKTVITGIF